ncbi:MAG: ABC transporter ATP-binding protein, partial [Acidobacteria bacterium]|nr:ABC transporter ATP-binding protein [Acidobacteriota bacterium]
YYYIFIMQRVNQDLRMALVERWLGLSLRYHSDHRVGDSVYRIYQDSAQVTAVIGNVTQSMQMLSTYAIGVVFLAALDPILGGMALSIVVLAVLWGRWFSPRMRERSLAAREASSDFTSRVQETFAAIRVIKAYGAADREQELLERDSVRAFNASFRVRSLMAVVGIVTFSIAAAALLSAQFLMAVWANGERETFATALVALVGLSFVTWNLAAYNWAQEQIGASSVSVRNVVTLWSQAQDMAMGLDRSFDILDIEPDVKNAPDAAPMGPFRRQIRFENVDFAYEPDRPVLRDVSFAVEPGSITAIVGPTGSGKSTLVSLLLRLFDPDSGTVSIDGVDLRKLDVDSLRGNVSVALQENVLFGMSVRDNIRYVVPDASDERVLEAARVACVDEYVAGLPEGLDTVLSDRGGKLSTGQRQRLSIARAIVKDAPILILDEPTAALDAYTEHRVLERLSAWGEGRAIFLITHRISTIQQADRILYLDGGRIVENGSHDELMVVDGGRYRAFVETEARLSRRAGEAG